MNSLDKNKILDAELFKSFFTIVSLKSCLVPPLLRDQRQKRQQNLIHVCLHHVEMVAHVKHQRMVSRAHVEHFIWELCVKHVNFQFIFLNFSIINFLITPRHSNNFISIWNTGFNFMLLYMNLYASIILDLKANEIKPYKEHNKTLG
jgi:hypothetical protein